MDTIPQCIQREIDLHNEAIAALSRWAPFVRELEPVLTDFADLHANPVPFDTHVTVYVLVTNMRRVVDLIRRLRAIGLTPDGHTDKPEEGRRTYHFKRADLGPYRVFSLYCTIAGGEGATCKYVPVGTQVVPVYELKCEGE